MTSEIERLLDEAGLSQTELAVDLSVDSSSISRKVAGTRPWKVAELKRLREILSQRLGREIRFDDLLSAVPAGARS